RRLRPGSHDLGRAAPEGEHPVRAGHSGNEVFLPAACRRQAAARSQPGDDGEVPGPDAQALPQHQGAVQIVIAALAPDQSGHPILNGMWQVSGAQGRIDPEAAVKSMAEYVEAGFTTWDLADHYGPAEDFVGEFRRRRVKERGEAALAGLQFFTKWVPRPGPMP